MSEKTEKTAQPDLQLVTFLMDGEEYGVDVMQVREIICLPEITPSHNSEPHVEGMISLRGNIVPIISLRKRLGLPQVEHDIDTRIAVMTFGGNQVGFIIDCVSEVMRVKRSEIQPASGTIGQSWIAGILNLEKLVVVVDLEKLGVV
jgi:purine-binding chemotaxis protein CheW